MNHCNRCKQTIFDLKILTSFQDNDGYLIGYTEYTCNNCHFKMFKPWKSVTRLKKIDIKKNEIKKQNNVKFGSTSIFTFDK